MPKSEASARFEMQPCTNASDGMAFAIRHFGFFRQESFVTYEELRSQSGAVQSHSNAAASDPKCERRCRSDPELSEGVDGAQNEARDGGVGNMEILFHCAQLI